MKLQYIISIILILVLTACGERLSGESDELFIASRAKVEKNLNDKESENLEKAFRVLAGYAMSEKWNQPEKYEGKSFDAIVLDVVDNKTYSGVVSFVESYLEAENEKKKERIKQEITILSAKIDSVKETAKILESIRPSEIKIVKQDNDDPKIQVTMVNKGSLSAIKDYTISLEVFSISENKLIDAQRSGGSRSESETYDNDFFSYVSKSLSDLMERSRRLQKQLQNAKFPISDLAKYDLKVEARPTEITLHDGTVYAYPKRNIEKINDEIAVLKDELDGYESIEGSLDEFELANLNQDETKIAFNEAYLLKLQKIRKVAASINLRTTKIAEGVNFSFPVNYEVKNERFPGMFSIYLSDSLNFSSDDERLIQYQITDTTYVEYEHSFDRPNGSLNVLHKPSVVYNVKEAINSMKNPSGYPIDFIDADDSGYLYRHVSVYRFARYFKIDGNHYYYSMDFKNLEQGVREFDRSKNMLLSL